MAFHDTDDILTWQIPRWYQDQPGTRPPDIEFVNVFIQNGPRWLVFEGPVGAHDGYFKNQSVCPRSGAPPAPRTLRPNMAHVTPMR